MKNKVLIIFKYPRGHWNIPIIEQFLNFYETEHLYISDFKNKNFTDTINEINELIRSKNIETTVFDVDYFKFINFFFIEKIISKKKILITGDDFELHEMNAITASACDLVLSACPLSVLKYKEKGYEAHFIHFENSKINKNINIKKDIDVLFFGALSPDRKEFLNYIEKEGIKLKNAGHEEAAEGITEEELLKLVSRSKIVLNFSKSRTKDVKNFSSENVFNFYYQFKGRIILAGLSGTACISEYSPGQELLFKGDELVNFFTKNECVSILKKYLKDDDLLRKYTEKFVSKVEFLCKEKNNFKNIFNSIERSEHRKVKLVRFPYWYLRIAAKQIILRNIKFSNIIKSFFQLKIIFQVIKKTNPLFKLIILAESLINIIWYSIILSLKFKK
tara:strand:+ start:730 stop:1899 length:1170 start_codon:yes stop_codon:yes gene_type:complete